MWLTAWALVKIQKKYQTEVIFILMSFYNSRTHIKLWNSTYSIQTLSSPYDSWVVTLTLLFCIEYRFERSLVCWIFCGSNIRRIAKMTQFLRHSNRLLSQFSRNDVKWLAQSMRNYSSKSNNTGDLIVSRKKKYIYVGCVLASTAGFYYYTKKEHEYCNYSRMLTPEYSNQ